MFFLENVAKTEKIKRTRSFDKKSFFGLSFTVSKNTFLNRLFRGKENRVDFF
jgi:hypothetical protein